MINIEPTWKRRVTAKITEEFICIIPQSGYRLAMADPTAPERLFAVDISDNVLGDALKNALKESRFLTLEEAKGLRLAAESQDDRWARSLMDRYGYKSKQALFKKMKSCSIVLSGTDLVFSPSHHEKLNSWSRSKDDGIEDVVIAAGSSTEELGAALRLAFSRCTE